jgi:hypothetical protein
LKLATYFSGELLLNTFIFNELSAGELRSTYGQEENQVFMKDVNHRRISLKKTATCRQKLVKFIYNKFIKILLAVSMLLILADGQTR